MIACAVVDLPEPDSPTMARVSPGYEVEVDAVGRAATSPSWVWKPTSRFLISSSGRPCDWAVAVCAHRSALALGSRASRRARPA